MYIQDRCTHYSKFPDLAQHSEKLSKQLDLIVFIYSFVR
jgi:hypothetical protein